MFSTYDLVEFSKRLKQIRKSLGYTQEDVVAGTGLSVETLRKLEKGTSIPKYDTIERLSLYYKIDLHEVLHQYKNSRELFKYYARIDEYIYHSEREQLEELIKSFETFSQENHHNLVDPRVIKQLNYLFKGLQMVDIGSTDPLDLEPASNMFIKALEVCITDFDIQNWKVFKYSSVELRILFALASVYGTMRYCELSNEILTYILSALDGTSLGNHMNKLLIIKAYVILSYNYHRLSDDKNALKFADEGIQFCNQHGLMSNMSALLSRKGIAMYHLKQDAYNKYLDASECLLFIQGADKLAASYKAVHDRFRNQIKLDA